MFHLCIFSENSNRYTLTSTPSSMQSHMYPPHHRPPGLSQPPKTIVSMPGYHEPPVLNHLPPTHQHPPSITVPPNISPQAPGAMNPQILSPENLRLVLRKTGNFWFNFMTTNLKNTLKIVTLLFLKLPFWTFWKGILFRPHFFFFFPVYELADPNFSKIRIKLFL